MAIANHLDLRLAAHLDGLAVAREHAWPFCDEAFGNPTPGGVFVAAVRALEEKHRERLDRLFALAEQDPELLGAFTSAFGWLERDQLRGTVADLLRSADPFRRMVGLAACAMHRVDPGAALESGIRDADRRVRARSLRAAGEIGRRDLLNVAINALEDDDPDCRFWAAWSAVLLGDRNRGVATLAAIGTADGAHRARAFQLALQALPVEAGHRLLQDLASEPAHLRWLIQGSGIVGDPAYVPWLIKQMADDKTTRLAGDALGLITGADLDQLRLARPRPEVVEAAPNDDPQDENVAMDPDEGLPWPDASLVRQWWDAHAGAFQPGARRLMGAPVARERCITVLKDGNQRQRLLAAHQWCLIEPGTPLFNTSAPAWRQQQRLARME